MCAHVSMELLPGYRIDRHSYPPRVKLVRMEEPLFNQRSAMLGSLRVVGHRKTDETGNLLRFLVLHLRTGGAASAPAAIPPTSLFEYTRRSTQNVLQIVVSGVPSYHTENPQLWRWGKNTSSVPWVLLLIRSGP